MYKYSIIFIALIFYLDSTLIAQNSTRNDTMAICKTVNNFFSWYINAIKKNKHTAFQPRFIETKNGMTTLDFTKYFNKLHKYGFSDSLIIKEKLSYQKCIDELGQVDYADFKTKYTDLDDYEKIECDFSNYYRWTGGQEPIDGIRIKNIKFNNSFSATVTIEYCDYNHKDKKNTYWGSNVVIMTKVNDNWKIDNINWK